jgi:hypothetical protein
MLGKSSSGRTSSIATERGDLRGYRHAHLPIDVRFCRIARIGWAHVHAAIRMATRTLRLPTGDCDDLRFSVVVRYKSARNADYGRGDGLGNGRAQARRSSNLVCCQWGGRSTDYEWRRPAGLCPLPAAAVTRTPLRAPCPSPFDVVSRHERRGDWSLITCRQARFAGRDVVVAMRAGVHAGSLSPTFTEINHVPDTGTGGTSSPASA